MDIEWGIERQRFEPSDPGAKKERILYIATKNTGNNMTVFGVSSISNVCICVIAENPFQQERYLQQHYAFWPQERYSEVSIFNFGMGKPLYKDISVEFAGQT